MHEGGGRWVGSNKLVELKKKKKASLGPTLEVSDLAGPGEARALGILTRYQVMLLLIQRLVSSQSLS